MGGVGLIAYYILKLKRGSGEVTYTLRRFVRVQRNCLGRGGVILLLQLLCQGR